MWPIGTRSNGWPHGCNGTGGQALFVVETQRALLERKELVPLRREGGGWAIGLPEGGVVMADFEHVSSGSLALRHGKAACQGSGRQSPKTQTYRVVPQGFRICLLFLKLVQRLYAPFRPAVVQPV